MKLVKRLLINSSFPVVVSALLIMGCTTENAQITGPENTPTLSSSVQEVIATAIIKEAIVTPDGGRLKITNINFNNADFVIQAGNVSDSLTMRLVKLSETSNTYHFEPFDMNMPSGVKIELEYDHSALPFGVSDDDLQVFQLAGAEYLPIESQVQKDEMTVSADIYSTGEFTLGAYDAEGDFHMIEGEYGLRKEAWIEPDQGGTIRLPGGSYLEIPEGAVRERTLIGMIATRETILGRSDSKAFTFTPHGTVFNIPIRLVLNWNEFAGEPVELLYFNEFTGEWEISAQGVWDESARTVTLELNHFSRYALAWSR